MYKSLRAQTLHYFARPHERVLMEPIKGSVAWRSADFGNADDWQTRLSADEVDELCRSVRSVASTKIPLGQLTKQHFPLPTLQPKIAQWRCELRHGRGFVLLRGVPVERWSETECEVFFWCLGQHLGIPGAQNPQGDLLGHVRDQRSTEDARYYRTSKAIAVHCDAADVVGLLCLQPARSGGLSQIASSVSVYNEILCRAPHLVRRLYQPFYFDTKGEGGVRAFPIAPCRYAQGELRTFWQSDYYRSVHDVAWAPALTTEDRQLLDLYDEIANSPEFRLDMDLQPGDVQLLSNHTVLHARTGFADWPEPNRQRHLLRLWITLPETRNLKLRWLTWKAFAGLTLTATRELLRTKLSG